MVVLSILISCFRLGGAPRKTLCSMNDNFPRQWAFMSISAWKEVLQLDAAGRGQKEF